MSNNPSIANTYFWFWCLVPFSVKTSFGSCDGKVVNGEGTEDNKVKLSVCFVVLLNLKFAY